MSNISSKNIQAAEQDHESFSDAPPGTPIQSCQLRKKTKAYWIEVHVVTRLGEIPVRGVKVCVAGENWESSDDKGTFMNGDQPRRKRYESSDFEISAAYVNTKEKLKPEEYRAQLSNVNPEACALEGIVRQEILKVEDMRGVMRDVDFRCEYPVKKHADEFTWLPGNDATQGESILRVILKLATFSLYVRYLNQNLKSDSVVTRPGPEADPEKNPHSVIYNFKNNEWPGYNLCSPTCCTMLVDYWLRIKGHSDFLNRTDVMQKYYDLWAKEKFPDRLDKTPPRYPKPSKKEDYINKDVNKEIPLPHDVIISPGKEKMAKQATPPLSPVEGCYWLDTSTEPYQLWLCEYKYDWLPSDREISACFNPKEPASPYPGELWMPEQSPPQLYEWKLHSYRWKQVAEGWWRVMLHTKEGSSNPVWQWHERTAKVVESYAPTGSVGKLGFKTKFEGRAPLSRCLSWEKETIEKGKVVNLNPAPLTDYKRWLSQGWPFTASTSATDGHVMLIRGAVVDDSEEIHWLIANDPYGNLASPGTLSIDFAIDESVGRNLDNHQSDVEAIQQALKGAGFWSGDIDGKCNGETEDPLIHMLEIYQFQVMGRHKYDYTISPGSEVAKKLGVNLKSNVGLSAAKRKAINNRTDVQSVQTVLDALGYYTGHGDDGICDDKLIEAIEAFQKQEKKIANGLIESGSASEKKLKQIVGKEGYDKTGFEKEINSSGTNTGDGARGQHVYYRNSTPGFKNELRIKPGTPVRIEYKLEPGVLAKQLTPGT